MHHLSLDALVKHYIAEPEAKGKPPITRIILWTDGCPNQYLCCQNFVKVAAFWWASKGIRLFHRFAPTADFKGVHDTIGKEDRRWITTEVIRNRMLVPQPHDLYATVKKGRPAPTKSWSVTPRTLAKKPRLALDRYFYRFIAWKRCLEDGKLPTILIDDSSEEIPSDIIADSDDKWFSTTPVNGCMSLRD